MEVGVDGCVEEPHCGGQTAISLSLSGLLMLWTVDSLILTAFTNAVILTFMTVNYIKPQRIS